MIHPSLMFLQWPSVLNIIFAVQKKKSSQGREIWLQLHSDVRNTYVSSRKCQSSELFLCGIVQHIAVPLSTLLDIYASLSKFENWASFSEFERVWASLNDYIISILLNHINTKILLMKCIDVHSIIRYNGLNWFVLICLNDFELLTYLATLNYLLDIHFVKKWLLWHIFVSQLEQCALSRVMLELVSKYICEQWVCLSSFWFSLAARQNGIWHVDIAQEES